MVVPDYDFNGKCTNSIIINEIYDTFKQAFIIVYNKNREVLLNSLKNVPFDEVSSAIDVHNQVMSKYNKIETEIKRIYRGNENE